MPQRRDEPVTDESGPYLDMDRFVPRAIARLRRRARRVEMATRAIKLETEERAVVCAKCSRPFAHLASDVRHHVFPRGFSPPEVDRVECPACGYHNLPGMPPAQPRERP